MDKMTKDNIINRLISKFDNNPRLGQPKFFGRRFRRKELLLLIVEELIVGVIMIGLLLHSVSLNSQDKINYADADAADEISASDGALIVNDVTVSVPADGNVSYNISYSWSKDDRKYPTIPRSITASYRNDDGKVLYDLSLYKDSFVPAKNRKPGQNAASWFKKWKTGEEGNVKREKLDSGNIPGFLISTTGSEDDTGSAIYESSTYYFAIETDAGIGVYVLEGNLYDNDSREVMQKAMKSAIDSISIKEQAA